ncbi:4-hydroxy-2-oxoheptanedioate aldolase [Seinonella peptonophila]|uniref:4-hydroxy-2-oxoheptanedioate aldolase n=1 Tax=Seinonella peptonophila TaxID=112248 RepID=A0A1M4Y728_9BACL|nr:aldolase/citrate lyase family protein [Seinonella peptonophila]SHF01614.1 4-hydroxy-2-oxoheptanedioate aldolase [Seinonella peptonophila]
MMTGNVRARLGLGETLYGLLVKMPSQAIIEMCAKAGFDLTVIDCEHGAGETNELEHHIRAAESFGIPAFVRIGSHSSIETLRALDAGASGIIVPHVVSKEDAVKAVQSVYYPPVGKRGLATSTRAGGHTLVDIQEHIKGAEQNITVILQIEDGEAISVLNEISNVNHVHMLFIGINDLSLSLGYPGQSDHPVVLSAVEKIIATIKQSDHLLLGAIAQNEQEARFWKEKGAKMILFPSTYLFAQKLLQLVDVLKS